MSRECLNGIYSEKCDYWSLGLIAFECLSGSLPFTLESVDVVYDQLREWEKYIFPIAGISESGSTFLKGLLSDEEKRFGWEQIRDHSWFMELAENPPLHPRILAEKKMEKVHVDLFRPEGLLRDSRGVFSGYEFKKILNDKCMIEGGKTPRNKDRFHRIVAA